MSFVLVRDRSRLGHKPDYRHGWSPEYVRKSMYACRSVSVACRPAEKRRRRGEIGSIHRSILVGHRRPNRPQGVNDSSLLYNIINVTAIPCANSFKDEDLPQLSALYIICFFIFKFCQEQSYSNKARQ